MKIKNELIQIKVNGKVVKQVRNRILDNFLNAMLYNVLDFTNATTLFPNFDNNSYMATDYLYLVYDTPITVLDTDTTITYDEKVLASNSFGTLRQEVTNTPNSSQVLFVYEFTTPSENQIVGLGFGENDTSVTDWLMAYVDIQALNLFGRDSLTIEVNRLDLCTTSLFNESNIEHLFKNDFYRMTSIDLYNGTNLVDSKDVVDLTFTLNGIADVLITGFDLTNVNKQGGLFPSTTTYPGATTYPAYAKNNIDRVVFNYSTGSLDYSAELTDLTQLDFDTTTGVVTINLTYERGA